MSRSTAEGLPIATQAPATWKVPREHRQAARPEPEQAAPALTVAAVIERSGHFLMVEEWVHGRRVLNQPAGHVEPGEALLAAVVRETIEETGWTFAPDAVTGVYFWRPPGSARAFLRVAISGHCVAHDADRRLDDGIIHALWLSRDQLLQRSATLRSPMVMRAIDDFLGGARHPASALDDLSLEGLLGRAERL